MANYTRAELERQKESLTAKLKEVTDQLEKYDETIYKGKFEKAIMLLQEVEGYLNYPTIEIECEDCGVRFDIDLADIIDRLKMLHREEFGR